jgi:hypothetical protein
MYYSVMKSVEVTPLQLLGSILPDAATTSAFSWVELHQLDRVENLASFVSDDSSLTPLITGLRHHLELDARSHDSWGASGGYAYTVQTAELRTLVQQALGCSDEHARIVAHNFIEAACDIRLATSTDLELWLQQVLDVPTVRLASATIAEWLEVDARQLQARVDDYLTLWQPSYATVDGMVSLWLAAIPHLNDSAFNGEIDELDTRALRAGIELALELVADSYLAVLTPSVGLPEPQ